MSIQTIFQAGNSQVVTIPKSMLFKTGQKVTLEKIDADTIVIKKTSAPAKKSTTEFKKWVKEVLEEDAEILEELALR